MLTPLDFRGRFTERDLFVLNKAFESLHKSACAIAPYYDRKMANRRFDVSVIVHKNGRFTVGLASDLDDGSDSSDVSVIPLNSTESNSVTPVEPVEGGSV